MTDERPAKIVRRKPRRAAPDFSLAPIRAGWIPVKSVRHHETGELVQPNGPPRFVAKAASGRPPLPPKDVILGLIAIECAKRAVRLGGLRKSLAAQIVKERFPRDQRTEQNLERVSRWLRDPTRRHAPFRLGPKKP